MMRTTAVEAIVPTTGAEKVRPTTIAARVGRGVSCNPEETGGSGIIPSLLRGGPRRIRPFRRRIGSRDGASLAAIVADRRDSMAVRSRR